MENGLAAKNNEFRGIGLWNYSKKILREGKKKIQNFLEDL
jgi:hypothetical protein